MDSQTKLQEALQKVLPHGLTMIGSSTTIQPKFRQEPINEETAASMLSVVWQEKFRIMEGRKWHLTQRYRGPGPWELSPEEKTIFWELMMMPTPSSLLPHIMALAVVKRAEHNSDTAAPYVTILADAVCDIPDAAVVIALKNIRNYDKNPYFPTIAEVIEEAESIYNSFKPIVDFYLSGKAEIEAQEKAVIEKQAQVDRAEQEYLSKLVFSHDELLALKNAGKKIGITMRMIHEVDFLEKGMLPYWYSELPDELRLKDIETRAIKQDQQAS